MLDCVKLFVQSREEPQSPVRSVDGLRGARRLAAALIIGALEDYLFRGPELSRNAEFWIFWDPGSYVDTSYVSFECACEFVDIDPNSFRRVIRRLKAACEECGIDIAED